MRPKEVSAKLDELSYLVKRTSDVFEAANVDATALYKSIEDQCAVATHAILQTVPINLDDYELSLAGWNIAWKNHREILLNFCKEHLGDLAKRKPKEPLPLYSKRMLFECHRAHLVDLWKEQLPKRGPRDTKFVEDPYAHELLRRWGGLSKQAFMADLRKIDQDGKIRAATALGLKVKVTAKAFPDKMHSAAVRFVNNTTLF